jgi:hypothetical protein
LFASFKEFRRGKRKKPDVSEFERHLEDNLFELYQDLKKGTYRHSHYTSFYITDPKQRHIHKASVRDRIVHHAVYRILYPIFDKSFIYDSYSCRIGKGTHRAVDRLECFSRKVSKNHTNICWSLKCDIKKFFASVNHNILFGLIGSRLSRQGGIARTINKEDLKNSRSLIFEIISSFSKTQRERVQRQILVISDLIRNLFIRLNGS